MRFLIARLKLRQGMIDRAPIPYDGPHSEDDLELFGEFRQLYPVEVEGRTYWVPEDNSVLRVLQYVEIRCQGVKMPWKNYCWSNTVGCCLMQYQEHPDAPARNGRACTVPVKPGMRILKLPKGGRSCPPKP